MKGSKKPILSIAKYISNWKNCKIKLIDSSFKDKCVAYCNELPFGILFIFSYLNIETMNIISSNVEINKNELLVNKSNELCTALKQLAWPHFLGFVNQLTKKSINKKRLLN